MSTTLSTEQNKGTIHMEERLDKKKQSMIEKGMLIFYLLCNIAMTIIGIKNGWSIWVVLLTDAGWLVGLILHWAEVQTYLFRAYAMTCLMHMSAILWSVCTNSFSMTVPVLSMLAVALVFYSIPGIIYITIGVSVFLAGYHLLVMETIDFSSGDRVLETALDIFSVIFIEYTIYVLNKKRLENMDNQMEIIESLKAAERSKDDFMANVSHEIRTPINTICGMSEIVLREELTDQVRSDVFSIQTAGRSLQSIVSDVLDFTELQTGKMALVEETYNITSTLNDVINMSLARKDEKQIELVVDCEADIPSGLIGDEQKIRRIIMNLVNNALKFTVEGCVSILISARKTDYGINLIVCVKDTGIGMRKEIMEKLFTSYNQADTRRNRQEEGVGLGLSISQEMVDMMGGFITVSSEFGKGSELQFVIPQKVADATPIASVRDREHMNIAIYVDMEKYDHPDVREAYGQVIYHMIAQLKVKSHICQNLAELRRRAERETFTHVFISIEEYEEDKGFFDDLSRTTIVVAILERADNTKISNPRIRRLFKPFFILPITMVLNDEEMMQGRDANYYYQGKFIAPDTKVLVVDDNLMNIRVVEGLLRPYKINTETATSGAEALEKIESMAYDAILMDHMMPEMDGIETLQRIRQKQGNYFKKIPVIAVTANAVGGMREVFLSEGFQDFIAKPIEVSVLERVLKRTLPQEKIIIVSEKTDSEAVEVLEKTESGAVEVHQEEAAQESRQSTEDQRDTDLPPDSFDEHLGVKHCGSLENYIMVLQLVADSGQEERDKIEQSYEKKDWKNYTILVHALKSTMQNIGVENLSTMAKELELAGKVDDEEFILERHGAMMDEYARILGLLEESKTVNRRS